MQPKLLTYKQTEIKKINQIQLVFELEYTFEPRNYSSKR